MVPCATLGLTASVSYVAMLTYPISTEVLRGADAPSATTVLRLTTLRVLCMKAKCEPTCTWSHRRSGRVLSQRTVRVVLVNDACEHPRYRLFSTDLALCAQAILRYRPHCQSEGLFRDAKQLTGLCDAQAQDQPFAVTATLPCQPSPLPRSTRFSSLPTKPSSFHALATFRLLSTASSLTSL